MVALLALPPLEDGQDPGPIVLCGCAPFAKKEVQNAGRAFYDAYESGEGVDSSDEDADAGSPRTGEGPSDAGSPSGEKGKKKKDKKEREDVLKLAEVLKGEDLYALLELDGGASQDDIRKAYRKMALVMHPDKQGDQPLSDEEKEAMNVRFIKVQEAFEVLNDPKKRRKYDSMGDFDDSIPSGLKENQDFFVVFGPVFKRNAKWSERKPVPDVGDEETSLDKVMAFYDWWREEFESWRDLDEKIREEFGEDIFQDLDEAECREERRWMERENAKLRTKFQKVERQRILKLVENAERCDPRIKAEKERQRLAREEEKAARERQKVEAERLKREEQERQEALARAEEEAKRAEKAKKDEQRQVRKAARAQLRKTIEGLGVHFAQEQLQDFLLTLDPEETDSLHSQLQKDPNSDLVVEGMKTKGMEAIILKDDERSTAEGSPRDIEFEVEARPARLAPKSRELTAEQLAEKAREEAKRVEEKAAREAKKRADQEAVDRERKKQEKKQAEKAKKEEQKKEKEMEKAAEKARQEKEANAKRAEEQREKARQEKEQAELQRSAEALQVAFERDRQSRAEAMDRLEWPAVIEAAQAAATEAAGALAAVSAEDPEESLDLRLACLGSFFVLGMRVSPDSPALSAALRNRVKKLREKIRKASDKGELRFEAPEAAPDEEALKAALTKASGLCPEPEEPAQTEAAPQAAPKSGKKSKAKAATPEDEDLDALLMELGAETTGKGKKGKKK